MLPKQPNQSLIDGLQCLQALAAGRQAVGVRGLARELNLEPTRVHRLLKTLAHLGLAEQTEDGKYKSGPGVHVLAAQALMGSGLVHVAMPILDRIASQLQGDLIVAMGVLWRDHVCYLYHGAHHRTGAAALGHSVLYPATRSGLGLLLLAHQSEDSVLSLYNNRDILGFSSMRVLNTELARIRKAGYADLTRQEHDRALAVGIGDKPTAALTLAGNISGDISKSLAALRETAADIEIQLTSYLKGS